MKWAILGTGNIAAKFATGLVALGGRAELHAVGSRSPEKARDFADRFRAPVTGDYHAVLADPQVEVVYIALPNQEHARWSILAAQAGKHILCEKPAAMNLRELDSVLAAVRQADVFFMEGFLWRCHPRTRLLRELAEELGELRMAHAVFCFDAGRPLKERLARTDYGGGALMDVGCYPISWLRLFGGEPLELGATATVEGGVDVQTGGSLRFGAGFLGTFATAVQCEQPTINTLYGERGSLTIHEPWRNTPGAPLVVRTAAGERTLPAADTGLPIHALEALHVQEHLSSKQAPAMTWDDSRGQQRTLDRLRAAIGVRWQSET